MRQAIILLLVALAFVGAAGTGAGAAERRIALVIGNGAYRNVPPLKNPPNDARPMAATLKAVGFELIGGKPLLDADKAALERAIRRFGQALRGGAVGLFYYSGHGVQINGANYLVPVGANIAEELDAKFELVDAGLVLEAMADARNRLNIMILDACRNNPFGGRGLRNLGAGLAQVTAPAGTVISYATQPGNVARDGTGPNSPYTEALAAALRQPGQDLFTTFNAVGLRVKQETHGQQQPWLAVSPIEGQFFFVPRGSIAMEAREETARPQAPAAGAADRAKSERPVAMTVPHEAAPRPGGTGRYDGIWQVSGRDAASPIVLGIARDCSYNLQITVAGDKVEALVPAERNRVRLSATLSPDGTFKTVTGDYGASLSGKFSGDAVDVVLRTSTCHDLPGKGQRAPR